MIGISGRFLRMRRAIGCVNSGLSMITTASGSATMAAAAVLWMRRRRVGSRDTIAAGPITATSSMGNCETRPICPICAPPTPT